MDKQTAGVGPVDDSVRPFAWVDPLYLRVRQLGGIMTVADEQGELRTEPLYTQASLDAAVAAERERCAKLCEQEHRESGEHPEMALHCAERIRGLRA